MSLEIRPMADHEAQSVADMVRGLARDLALGVIPSLTGPKLLEASGLVNVVVASERGKLLGACLYLMTYSTFRAAKGMYVVDLFIQANARNRNVGLKLLRGASQFARSDGAEFIKLEVDHTNEGGARFYERLGFKKKPEDRLFILEQDDLSEFIKGE
jgi:ribosomal protein S18 acetylase RimI-like enzyme